MSQAKVIFCSRSPIPGPTAEALHVVQCCNAIAGNQFDVTLRRALKLWRPSTWRCNIDQFYGLAQTFKARSTPELPRTSVPYDSLVVNQAARTGALLYTRDLRVLHKALKKSIPFAVEIHGTQDPRELDLILEGIAAKLCRGIIVITQGVKKYLCEHSGKMEPYILVAPDAVEPNRFDYQPTASGDLALGYVGSLNPGKGMEIVAPLAEELPDVDIHVYGGHPKQVTSWKEKCKSSPNLHFHGYVKPRDIPACFNQFSIGLLPNQPNVVMAYGNDIGAYTSPMKLFEYMAAGKLVVASDIPVIREIVRNKENGVLVPHGEPKAWAQAIRQLSEDPQSREKIISEAREEAVSQYSYDIRFRRVFKHIDKITLELCGNDR